MSDKEHPWLISDDNVRKRGLHQRIPRVLIARLHRLLQQNIVADRRYTYQRQTIGKVSSCVNVMSLCRSLPPDRPRSQTRGWSLNQSQTAAASKYRFGLLVKPV